MTDKIKQQALKKFNDNLNKLDNFDKNLILWVKKNKPIIYTIIRSVSRSGMLRRFSIFVIKDNGILYLNNLIEHFTHYKRDSEGYLKVYGCGMDMAFKLVADFSETLFNDYNILHYRLI